jgi:bile acid-coenzyme A ligase
MTTSTAMTTPEGIPIGQRFDDLAEADPERASVVIVHRDGSAEQLNRRELNEHARRWGRALAARGVGVGDRVALPVHNSFELVLGALGAWEAGATPVPVRWDLPDWERDRVLAVIAAAVVVDEHTAPELRAAAAKESAEPFAYATPPHSMGICSSGSTGTPKVILNTRPGVWTKEASTPFAENFGLPVSQPQTILVPAPMYHTNGFMTLNSMLGGDCLVILEKFDAALMVDAIERFAVTTFTATPTMLQRVAALPSIESRDLSTVEWILQGAATMPPALLRTWFDLLAPEKVIMAYGMTEQLGLTALTGSEWLTHEGSVGRGFRDTEIRILDEAQNPVPIGDFGDVYMRSPSTGAYDYLGGAPLLPATADGFGTAGDIGRLDGEGYLYLADRRVDMIISGGANIFPAEVESALSEHPGIADAVVIGLSDPNWGKRVHAVVERMPEAATLSEADVIAFAKERLASYKAPKSVEFVAQLPRSAATKISRSALVLERGG